MLGPLVIAILAMIVVGAVGFALVPSAIGGGRAEQRLKSFQGDIRVNRLENDAARTRDQRRKELQQTLKSQTAALNQKKRVSLKQLLFQAGMTIKPAAFIRNSVIFGAVAFVILIIVQVPVYFAPVFAVAAAYLLPRMYVNRKRRIYQDRFLDELPNAVEAIVRGVKTGLPLNDSIRVVAKDAKEPVKSEFGRVLDQQAFGMSMTEAVGVLLDRVPLPEVNFFVVVITVQQQAGGNLSEALGNLAKVLRNRKKMKQKIKAMSSEAKASAGIIGSLPFVVGILVSLTSPTYLAPLFFTTLGNIWLGIGVVMLSAGIFVMSKMVKFDY
ncbi:type II secretion system F family protein [Devosia sp. J2-20]|jgi:tight adherence protein B|uniref:Type II secretion system F family protein n=1 Tax=Devosia litorisediminis TaxID=2829817 RepID=A0A942EH89_9HYPH|nr:MULTISPECIES: type II secretion system F family protein [Devosia]MBS3849931.1 type II secretion system F family protein [Devosia litorisediminis]MCZ4346931.1 type II secretion system F family protein [Devosia neptuniae]WDR00653.1 type II secretion system F family protein [Devosia sp. J2-20]|tara:strand:- start:25018 stop:25995 length:978 start_codon:yes stop_codon:yes gene_type:complete